MMDEKEIFIKQLINLVLWKEDDAEDFFKFLLRPEIFPRVEFVEEHPPVGQYDGVILTAADVEGVPFFISDYSGHHYFQVDKALQYLERFSPFAAHKILIALRTDHFIVYQYLRKQQRNKEIDAFLGTILNTNREELLKLEIDRALDNGNKQRFMEVSAELKRLKGRKVYAAN